MRPSEEVETDFLKNFVAKDPVVYTFTNGMKGWSDWLVLPGNRIVKHISRNLKLIDHNQFHKQKTFDGRRIW